MRRVCVCLIIALLVVPAVADAGDWIARLRLIGIYPNDDSETIGATGTGAAVDSAWTAEVDLTYMFNENWGLEVIAGTAKHDLTATGGALAGADLGSVSHLPPTFTLQYHFPNDKTDFYLGAGINYTLFYSYDLSADLAGLGVSDLDFDSSFGLAGNLGLDINLNEKWLFNFDVKYIMIDTDVDIELASGGILDTINVDINPWVIGAGVGVRF